MHPGHAVPGGGGQRLPHRGGGAECPPGLCLRRRSAGFGNPLAVAGGKPLFVRVPHLPRPAGGDPEQPAGASGGGVPHQPGLSGRHGGNPRFGPGVPPARHLAAGGQRPWGLSAVFAALPPPPGFGRRFVLRFRPQDPAGAHRRGISAPLPHRPGTARRRWPSPPWGCLAPPAPLI